MNESVYMDDINVASKNKNIAQILTHKMYLAFKRIFDFVLSFIGCILLLPLMIIVKVSYLISSDKSSIFYKQKRIGKNGKVFYIYKFRTMVPDADKILIELLKQDKYRNEWDLYQKFSDDPRITKVGKFLRKTSLDEMPQFINILKGDMSFIGPRPLVEGELDSHNGNHAIYEKVRPGLTSWWAVNGRSNITYQERLNLEYYYVQHMSLLLDIKCIWKTVLVVLGRTGAK